MQLQGKRYGISYKLQEIGPQLVKGGITNAVVVTKPMPTVCVLCVCEREAGAVSPSHSAAAVHSSSKTAASLYPHPHPTPSERTSLPQGFSQPPTRCAHALLHTHQLALQKSSIKASSSACLCCSTFRNKIHGGALSLPSAQKHAIQRTCAKCSTSSASGTPRLAIPDTQL